MRSAYRSLLLTVLTTLAWMPTIQCGLAASTGDLPNTPQSKTLDPGWPREITRNGVRLVYYQPQVDEWKNLRELRARFAFVLTLNGAKPVAGVEEVRGDTHTDLERRTVLIDNIEIVDIRFPSLSGADETKLQDLLKSTFPGKPITKGGGSNDVTSGLDREASARQRGSQNVNLQQQHQQSGARRSQGSAGQRQSRGSREGGRRWD